MRLRCVGAGLLLVGCAGVATRPTADGAGVFDVSEAKAKEMVRAVLAPRGLTLLDTLDPHVLMTPRRVTTLDHQGQATALVPTFKGPVVALRGVTEAAVTDEQFWMVVFEPRGPTRTAVRVLRSQQLSMSNSAERTLTMVDASALPAPDPRVPPNFVPDREKEAAVAAELEGQVSVEVAERRAGANEEPQVKPLQDPSASAVSSSPPHCRLDEGPLEGTLSAGHFLLMSDPLGAQEPWAIVDGLLCLARSHALPVTLALSMPASEQRALNTYLDSRGTKADRDALLSGAFWVRPWQDGRTSLAVFEQLERVRLRRARGEPVNVLAADSELTGNPRQAALAARLSQHREQNPARLIVAMLGNTLTSQKSGADWNPELIPAGARLFSLRPELTHSFDVAFSPGEHWTCHLFERGTLRCGTWAATPSEAQRADSGSARPSFRRGTDRAFGFDGVYFAGTLTASPPAVESARVDEGPAGVRGSSR